MSNPEKVVIDTKPNTLLMIACYMSLSQLFQARSRLLKQRVNANTPFACFLASQLFYYTSHGEAGKMQILDLFWRLVLTSLFVKMKLVYLYRFYDSMGFFLTLKAPPIICSR